MEITDTAMTLVSGALSDAGFDVRQAYTSDQPQALDTAVLSAAKVELSELDSVSGSCRAEVTVTAKLLAAEKGFFGAERFSGHCESALKSLYFGSAVLISRAELSGLGRNIQLRRCERTLTVTAVFIINREEEAS